MASRRNWILAVGIVLTMGALTLALCVFQPRPFTNHQVATWALDRMWCGQAQAMIRAFGSVEATCVQMSRRSNAIRNDIQDLGGTAPSADLDDGVWFASERGILETTHGTTQEFWFEVIWYDAAQQEMVALVTVLEHPFLQFDTEFPFVLLIRTSATCTPNAPARFSLAEIDYRDVSVWKWAPWMIERQGDELEVSLKGGSTWVLPKPEEGVSP